MPQLDPTWFASQIFWLFIAFSLLYVLVSRVLLPPILGVLTLRKSTVDAGISDAEKFRQEAEKARNEYEKKMAEARQSAKALFTEAEKSIEDLTGRANQQMDLRLAERLKEAEKRIASAQTELKSHFDKAGAALVADIAAKLTGNAPALVEAQKAFDGARGNKSS